MHVNFSWLENIEPGVHITSGQHKGSQLTRADLIGKEFQEDDDPRWCHCDIEQNRNQDFAFENRAYSPNDSSADTDRQFDKSTDYEPLLPFVAAAHYTATSQQLSSTRLKATRGWLRRKQHDPFYSVDTSGYFPIFFRLTQSSEVSIVFSRSRIR